MNNYDSYENTNDIKGNNYNPYENTSKVKGNNYDPFENYTGSIVKGNDYENE